jgi:hypothetical protein
VLIKLKLKHKIKTFKLVKGLNNRKIGSSTISYKKENILKTIQKFSWVRRSLSSV